MDNRKDIKVGDYFRIIRPKSDNEVRNNQNRFSTCKLETISGNEWKYVQYWQQYHNGDYPFLSNTITWNVYSEYALTNCIIEKIDNPEDFKPDYVQKMVDDRVEELKKKFYQVSNHIVITAIKSKTLDISELISINEKLKLYKAELPTHTILAFDLEKGVYNNKIPFISVKTKDKKWCARPSRIIVDERVFVCEGIKVPIDETVPNDELYPIDFAAEYPWNSVFKNSECERLASRILYHTESWDKPLTWEEYYETMSERDKSVSNAVKRDFDRVLPYLESPETCATFSPSWAKLLDKKN